MDLELELILFRRPLNRAAVAGLINVVKAANLSGEAMEHRMLEEPVSTSMGIVSLA
jgi:hypothetical protein